MAVPASDKRRPVTAAGMIFSVLFCLFAAGEGWYWLAGTGLILGPDRVLQGNFEMKTFGRIGQISRAQQNFLEKSMDFLGQKQFARFLAHLWICPNPQGTPVPLDLVPIYCCPK